MVPKGESELRMDIDYRASKEFVRTILTRWRTHTISLSGWPDQGSSRGLICNMPAFRFWWPWMSDTSSHLSLPGDTSSFVVLMSFLCVLTVQFVLASKSVPTSRSCLPSSRLWDLCEAVEREGTNPSFVFWNITTLAQPCW
jgi:hypothetical protein